MNDEYNFQINVDSRMMIDEYGSMYFLIGSHGVWMNDEYEQYVCISTNDDYGLVYFII